MNRLPSLTRKGRGVLASQLALALLMGFVLWVAIGFWSGLLPRLQDSFEANSPVGWVLDDYGVFYSAAKMVAAGDGDQIYDLEALKDQEAETYNRPDGNFMILPFFNPPAFAALLVPLTFLPFSIGAQLFLATSLATLGLSLLILFRPLNLGVLGVLTWVAFVAAYAPVRDALLHGQLSFLLLLIWVGSFVLFRQGREMLAGAALGLLLLKPYMALIPLLVLLCKRRWGAAQGFLAVALAGLVLSVLVAGPGALVSYPRLLTQASGWDGMNAVFLHVMFGWNGFMRVIVGPGQWDQIFLAVAILTPMTLAVAAWAWLGEWQPQSPRFAVQFAALILAVLLTSPHLYRTDLVLLVMPAALLVGTIRGTFAAALLHTLLVAVWAALLIHFIFLPDIGFNIPTLLMAVGLVIAAAAASARLPLTEEQVRRPWRIRGLQKPGLVAGG